jgi:acylphosphatase
VTALRAVLRGRVQGVGFRWFAERNAQSLGIHGWVRNRPDGTVETLAEGEEKAVGEYLARLSRGPSGSRVDEVVVEEAAGEGLSEFEVRR